MIVERFGDGIAICGDSTCPDVLAVVATECGALKLTIADPPYGNIVTAAWDRFAEGDESLVHWMLGWSKALEPMHVAGASMYVWGGIGKPHFRPFYKYMASVETKTSWQIANHITWHKKRGYGVQNNYLFTREELAFLVLGDAKKPAIFNIPLLSEKRGYAGYNAKYPAKSEYLRRTNVWNDVTEILRGKTHPTQKPTRLHEIIIETHTAPGDYVFDPFAGSGVTAKAARALGRRFAVVERCDIEFEKMVRAIRSTESKVSAC